MTVEEFYIGMGEAGDWECRRKIEKAVMLNYTISWRDTLTDQVIDHIINAEKENINESKNRFCQ